MIDEPTDRAVGGGISYQTSLWDPVDCPAIDLAGVKVAITGGLVIARQEAVEALQRVGGIYASSVTGSTDYLVIGNLRRRKVTQKLLAARKQQEESGKVSLITPYEFYLSLGLIDNAGE